MSIQVLDADGDEQTISTIGDLMAMVATAARQDTGNASLAALIALLPPALGPGGGGLKIEGVATGIAVPVSTPPTIKVSSEQTVAATAHAAHDTVGGKISFVSAVISAGGGGTIQSAVLRDKAGNEVPYDLFLFDSDPSAATITDDAPFVLSTDLAKCIGVIEFAGMAKGGTPGVISMPGLGLQFKLASGTTLYGALVVRGTGATYASTSDVSVDLTIIPG